MIFRIYEVKKLKTKWNVMKKAQVHIKRGNCFKARGEIGKAITEFSRALEINPNLAEAHNLLGILYMHKGKYWTAIKSYEKAIEINPSLDEAHYNLGLIYFQMKLYKEAILALKSALKINPKNPQVLETYREVVAKQS